MLLPFLITMYICLCNATTEDELEQIISSYPNITLTELQEAGIADNCYKCLHDILDILEKHQKGIS